jgi:hypothetical protein
MTYAAQDEELRQERLLIFARDGFFPYAAELARAGGLAVEEILSSYHSIGIHGLITSKPVYATNGSVSYTMTPNHKGRTPLEVAYALALSDSVSSIQFPVLIKFDSQSIRRRARKIIWTMEVYTKYAG